MCVGERRGVGEINGRRERDIPNHHTQQPARTLHEKREEGKGGRVGKGWRRRWPARR